ncbi:MAG TPA: NAD(P)H-binding protein [Vicinamibacterales bacterium]
MFAVAGVTGQTGSLVADRLLAQGHHVRAIVRNAARGEGWQARGAELAVADLADRPAMRHALTDVRGAYLLIVPDPSADDVLASTRAMVDAMAAAAAEARVPHVVVLSSIGVQVADPRTGPIQALRYAESRFRDIPGTACTFVRAPYFTENWLMSADAIRQHGTLSDFIPVDLEIDTASVQDVARVAADALVQGGRGLRVVELTGPSPTTLTRVAAELSDALGRPIQAVELPIDQAEPTFRGIGLSADLARLYRLMYEGIAAGVIRFEEQGTELVRGVVSPGEALAPALGLSARHA